MLRAVVDETEIVQNGAGRTLEIEWPRPGCAVAGQRGGGRDLYPAHSFQAAARHAAPYGLSWGMFRNFKGQAEYSVSSGESQWRALEGFTRWVGGFVPRITAEGLLLPAAWKDNGRRFVIGAGTPLLELRWQDRRYGVYSEVLVVDKVRRQRQRVKHTAFLDRGGCCRRVLYVPGRSSSAAIRYTGAISDQTLREGDSAADGGAAGKTRSSAGKRGTYGAQ